MTKQPAYKTASLTLPLLFTFESNQSSAVPMRTHFTVFCALVGAVVALDNFLNISDIIIIITVIDGII
jgi:hypothetical protein